MKRTVLFLAFLLALLCVVGTGCSSNNSDERWDYRDGFVVAKEGDKILVVRDKVADSKAPLSEILENAKPNAMWISVDKADYDAVTVDDRVSINFPNGGVINQSYPAQTTADVDKK
ncbi:hypothetical protein Back11_61940 [Paenibacillus baekrokdamisoli]|uniref:Uncharacterized protein n=1 Tax=Paenibacillus baekrokdamisoli TaxID=1712516 RepID=A0A3G9JP62_9BACL|nr:DUF3221 domain-containing protein [Paenibacillus baekrokdamisoli]MBB3072266.1 hypothetical protein [Paenibacillus baekrokdamisoli]BBH24849.1 hypothetical protein Back11_61940 [Paenibacillus baekrokdamisoli]